MKGNQATIMAVIAAIVTIFIGIMVVISVSNAGTAYTITTCISNETNTSAIAGSTVYTLATASEPCFACDITTITVTNSTDTWTTANYTGAAAGTVTFGTVDTSQLDTAYFSYCYADCPDDYWTAYQSGASNFYSAITLLAVATIVLAAVFILSYFGYGRKN